MKRNKLIDAIGMADEEYILEADPEKQTNKSRAEEREADPKRKIRKWMTVAACFLVVITALNLALFIPYNNKLPDISKYEGSEYYSIIQKLNELTHREPRYKNNFELLRAGLLSIEFKNGTGDAAQAPTSAPVTNSGNQYAEITDNQVDGVTEADRIKRSDKYIYYLGDACLYVYSIDGKNTALAGVYKIRTNGVKYSDEWEFYLSKDCKTVTVIAPTYDHQYGAGCTTLISLDVTDPGNITEKGSVSVTGGYISTRVVDGKLLMMTNFRVQLYDDGRPDFDNAQSFLPSIDKGEGFEVIPVDDIITPETLSSARYTVICKLDESTLEFEDASALLSYSQEVYVSKDKIFATHGYTKTEGISGSSSYRSTSMTDISALSYNDGKIKHLGTVTVEGYVKDQYSLDEYEGMLRVVTTTDVNTVGTSANLYCISLDNYEIVSSVVGFAPLGETVRSVRFDGEDAYVCTAVQLTDPVFFFDLSDVNNITYKETGTIAGYSTSLIDFGNGYLLGVGVGERWGSLKIEVYEEGENNVVSVDAYELDGVYYSENYKAYYVDRENQLIGLGISDNYSDGYIVIQFDGYRLREIIRVSLYGNNDQKRGVLIDEYMYMFSGDSFKVVNINETYATESAALPEKVVWASVSNLYGIEKYTFSGSEAQAIGDYFRGLKLTGGFYGVPGNYSGNTWVIVLQDEKANTVEIYHIENKYLKINYEEWYEMEVSQAKEFHDLISKLNGN